MRTGALALTIILLTAAVAPGHAAEDPAVIAKNLAENILGKGLVRSSRMAHGGRSVIMVWESATYKPANSVPHTRELLQIEAQLTADAVLRVMTAVQDVEFKIVLGRRSLATGAVRRSRPMHIVYAKDLGG